MNPISFIITPFDINDRSVSEFNSIWGEFYLKVGTVCFPDDTWYDAISSMLIIWSAKILDLLTKKKKHSILHFMDGPYLIDITILEHDILECKCIYAEQERIVINVPLETFVSSFLESTETFISSCQSNLSNPTSCDILKEIISFYDELAKIETGLHDTF